MRANLATLVEEFRKHAAETAVVAHRGNRRYPTTYGQLAEIAGRFAAELERRGIVPGDRVVLWGENSAEWIGVFYGCLLRGAIAVPLDAAGTPGFTARVIRDVAPRLIVGDLHLLRELEGFRESGEEHVPGAKAPADESALVPGLKSRPISETTATTQPISETTATTQPISETTATTQPISEATNEGNPPFRDETAEEWATRGN